MPIHRSDELFARSLSRFSFLGSQCSLWHLGKVMLRAKAFSLLV